MIALDINEGGALPRRGFEMYPMTVVGADYQALRSAWLTTTSADGYGLTGRLVDMAPCLPEKAKGLLSWPKCHNVYGEDGAYRLYMGINHVKPVIDGAPVQAKAYAGLKCHPLGGVRST